MCDIDAYYFCVSPSTAVYYLHIRPSIDMHDSDREYFLSDPVVICTTLMHTTFVSVPALLCTTYISGPALICTAVTGSTFLSGSVVICITVRRTTFMLVPALLCIT